MARSLWAMRSAKADINRMISGPDNPRIRRLSGSCFVMMKSDMGIANWTPDYYDFRRQYSLLRGQVLKRRDALSAYRFLKDALVNGTFRISQGTGDRVVLHPDVLKLLRAKFNKPEHDQYELQRPE